MRSRFSAYATAHYHYILDTYTKEKQQSLSVEDLASSAQGAKWFALKVHPTHAASTVNSLVDDSVNKPVDSSINSSVYANTNVEVATDTEQNTKPNLNDNTTVVEFTAYYFENKSIYQLHETSNFIVEDGKWRYHDGELHEDCGKIKCGRNLPCVCGSNKKFKQCCALKNR